MIVLDTNVLSALMQSQPEAGVLGSHGQDRARSRLGGWGAVMAGDYSSFSEPQAAFWCGARSRLISPAASRAS